MKRIISEEIITSDTTLKRVWNEGWDERFASMPPVLTTPLGQFEPFGPLYSEAESVKRLMQQLVLITYKEFRKFTYGKIIDAYNRYPTWDEEAVNLEVSKTLEDLSFNGVLDEKYVSLSASLDRNDAVVDSMFAVCTDYIQDMTEVMLSPAGMEFIKRFYDESDRVYEALSAVGYAISEYRLDRLVDSESGIPELIILELIDLEFVEAIQVNLENFEQLSMASKEYINDKYRIEYIITINDRITRSMIGEHVGTGDVVKIYKMKPEVENAVNN